MDWGPSPDPPTIDAEREAQNRSTTTASVVVDVAELVERGRAPARWSELPAPLASLAP